MHYQDEKEILCFQPHPTRGQVQPERAGRAMRKPFVPQTEPGQRYRVPGAVLHGERGQRLQGPLHRRGGRQRGLPGQDPELEEGHNTKP